MNSTRKIITVNQTNESVVDPRATDPVLGKIIVMSNLIVIMREFHANYSIDTPLM